MASQIGILRTGAGVLPPVRPAFQPRTAPSAADGEQGLKKAADKNLLEMAMHLFFLICGITAVGFVLCISAYLIISGLPAIREIGALKFLFGAKWAPTASSPSYGILPFILTSIYGTAGAVAIGVPVGLMTAVYLAKEAPDGIAKVIRAAVDLLAGIPSVVYGLVGMIALVPMIQKVFALSSGATLLAAVIVLTVMILPSIISVSETALRAVPEEYEAVSLALGATETETYMKVSVRAARSGIATAVVLGIGRAIGEAMAIIMVSGNVANMPSVLKPVRFMTTAIASEMSYAAAGSLQKQALYSIGLVLFLFIMLINGALNLVINRGVVLSRKTKTESRKENNSKDGQKKNALEPVYENCNAGVRCADGQPAAFSDRVYLLQRNHSSELETDLISVKLSE